MALHFSDFRIRKAKFHCADNAVHLFWIASAHDSATLPAFSNSWQMTRASFLSSVFVLMQCWTPRSSLKKQVQFLLDLRTLSRDLGLFARN